MRRAFPSLRGVLSSLSVAFLVSAGVLLLATELHRSSRDQVFATASRIFVVAAEMTANGISNGYFEWDAMRDLVAEGEWVAVDGYLSEIAAKYRFVTDARIEPGNPPGPSWEYEARAEDLDIVFPIEDSEGKRPIEGYRAVVRINAAALLREAQAEDDIHLLASGGRPLAFGLQADFSGSLLVPMDWLLALALGFLSAAPLVILSSRQSRFFYESKGLETIIYLFEKTERYSANHSRNVAALAAYIGTTLGFKGRRLRDLYAAALLHDIGKISTPPEILIMPRPLLPGERDTVKQHPEVSASILSNFAELSHLAEFARCHHERLDGSGYPAGLGSADIPLESRIIAIADVFEALTGERPYRSALPPDEAFSVMERESLDPEIFALFRVAWPRYAEFKLPRWALRWAVTGPRATSPYGGAGAPSPRP